jgi:hypothetical protein
MGPSINGLGEEDMEEEQDDEDEGGLGLEAAVVSSDEGIMRDASKWFDRHWKSATTIDKPLLNQVRPLWLSKKKLRIRLLTLLVADPKSIHRLPIRLVVFEEGKQAEYDEAWDKIKSEYSEDDIRKHGWNGENNPFYLDHSARGRFQPGDYMVDYWAEPTGAGFRFTGRGGVWRFKKSIDVEFKNGKKTKALLFDEVKEVCRLNFGDQDYETLGLCVRDHLRRETISDRHILIDVRLSQLESRYPNMFRSLKRRLAAR